MGENAALLEKLLSEYRFIRFTYNFKKVSSKG